MVGAIIEFPELLGESEVEAALHLLEGPSVQTIAAIAKYPAQPMSHALKRSAGVNDRAPDSDSIALTAAQLELLHCKHGAQVRTLPLNSRKNLNGTPQ